MGDWWSALIHWSKGPVSTLYLVFFKACLSSESYRMEIGPFGPLRLCQLSGSHLTNHLILPTFLSPASGVYHSPITPGAIGSGQLDLLACLWMWNKPEHPQKTPLSQGKHELNTAPEIRIEPMLLRHFTILWDGAFWLLHFISFCFSVFKNDTKLKWICEDQLRTNESASLNELAHSV